LSKVVSVRHEKGVLKLLEPVDLREGEEVGTKIEVKCPERLKELIGILRENLAKRSWRGTSRKSSNKRSS